MGRKEDLELNIRESSDLIQKYETIERESDRPEERKRARRIIDEQWGLIKGYLDEYRSLVEASGAPIPDDIALLTARDTANAGGTSGELSPLAVQGQASSPGGRVDSMLPRATVREKWANATHDRAARVRLIVAIVLSALLSLLVGLLSNLAATYLAPSLADRPWIAYGALIITFLLVLPLTVYLAIRSLPAREEANSPVAGMMSAPAAPAIGTSDQPTSTLPTKIYRELVGRDDVVAILMAALQDPSGKWIVAIDGMGGIGKTALAREVAEKCQREGLFEAVVWEIAPKSESAGMAPQERSAMTFGTIMDAIGRQLGAPDVPRLSSVEKQARVRALLGSRKVLIVLDNLETARDPQNEIARLLLTLLGSSKALLTSRHRFDGDLYAIHLPGLDEDGSLRLIHQEAEEKGIDRVAGATADELKQIAKATGGSPLALKLVVGQLGHLALSVVLTQLRNAKLPTGDLTEDEYVRFYKFIFLPSWALLSDGAQSLLISMAHFAPGVGGTLEAIRATSGLDEYPLTRSIDELWRLSFLEVGQSPTLNKIRYYLHALTQYFVLSDIVKVLK